MLMKLTTEGNSKNVGIAKKNNTKSHSNRNNHVFYMGTWITIGGLNKIDIILWLLRYSFLKPIYRTVAKTSTDKEFQKKTQTLFLSYTQKHI